MYLPVTMVIQARNMGSDIRACPPKLISCHGFGGTMKIINDEAGPEKLYGK